MNWAIVVQSDIQTYPAFHTHTKELCNALAKFDSGYLFTYASKHVKLEGLRFKSIEIHPPINASRGLGQILGSFLIYLKLCKASQIHPFDCVYARATAFLWGPRLFTQQYKVPLIIEVNGLWREEQQIASKYHQQQNSLTFKISRSVRNRTIEKAIRSADLIIAVTPQIAQYLILGGITEGCVQTVPNGVNLNKFFPISQSHARAELGLENEMIYMGYVGSLSAWQGVDDLLRAHYRLLENQLCKLLIVGDGPMREVLEETTRSLSINPYVIFIGQVPFEKVPLYISACDFMVAPKKRIYSGYSSLKVFEYAGCSRPIVAPDVPGFEFIKYDNCGLLYNPEDIIDMANKIEIMINIPIDRRLTMGRIARKVVEQRYTWDRSASQIRQAVIKMLVKV